MTLRNFPPADQCTADDLDAIVDLVVRDPRASYDLAGSRAHIEALCQRYQDLARSTALEAEAERTRSDLTIAALQRSLAAATNDLDAARTEIRALATTLDHERNERQGEVLAAEADRERADKAQAIAEIFETTARAALALVTRPGTVDLAELVLAVNGRLSRALVRERQISAAFSAKLEEALLHLEESPLEQAFATATRNVTGRSIDEVNIQLDAELAAHPDVGPLHHARDQRDHQEDTTP